jgi:hypothetical protein
MGFSVNSKIRDLIANPEAKAIFDKYAPGMSSDARMEMAMHMSVKSIAPFSQGIITNEKLKAMDEELKKLGSA